MDGVQAVSVEEANHQTSTTSLEHAKRIIAGPSGQITVTMDTRALAPEHRVFYRNLHKFRVGQMNSGIDLTELSDEQWGMVQLDKCHHISTTSTSKDGPQSYRVRICKTCCQEDSHIELGTYVDQESAILVNDTFEILNDRLDRLIVLRVEDKPDLHHLVAKKYDRSKGRDYACILELISERISAIEGKKRKPSVSEMIPAFAKRGDVSGGASSGDLHSSTQYSSCSTSSEASDEHRTASRLSAKPISAATSMGTLGSAVKPVVSTHRRTPTSARKLSIGSVHDIEVASNSGSASTIDDDITVTEETSTALRELSSICYQRLLSPSIHSTVPDSARLSPGTVLTGTSLFSAAGSAGNNSTADLVRSLEAVRSGAGSSGLSSVPNSASKQLSSPFSTTSISGASASTAVHDAESPPTTAAVDATTLLGLSAAAAVVAESEALHRSAAPVTGSAHKRPRPDADDSYAALGAFTAPPSSNFASADTNSYYSSYERLAGAEGMTPRKRAATFSVSDSFAYRYSAESHNPIATLTWLASMEETEVDVARSLFELRGNTEVASALFDSRGSALSMALNLGAPGNFGSYMATGRAGEMEEDDEYYDQDGDEGYGDVDDEGGDGEVGYYAQMQQQFKAGGFPYAHTGKGGVGMGGGGVQRARSSSMSMLDRSEAAWAILGNTGGYRSRMDPLSMALKKYHERGGSANAAASGFIGIYSPEDRKQRILRFLEKRKRRMWTKKVKYDVRKNFADSRVRVKGRFVKKQEEDSYLAEAGDRLNTSHTSHTSRGSNNVDDSMDADGLEGDEHYDHNDVDLELLDHLNAQQHQHQQHQHQQHQHQQHQQGQSQVRASPKNVPAEAETAERGLNLRLKLSGRSSGPSSGATGTAGSRRRSDSTSSAKGDVKAEARSAELKLTISTGGSARRRRNSSVGEEADLAGHTGPNGTSPSAVAVRLERASLHSAVKPPPSSE